MEVYFDNAATTPIDPRVAELMQPYFYGHHGNPSSIHSHGRDARNIIEKCRKDMAPFLGCSPAEIFFTSGGTEADNAAIAGSLFGLGVERVITSPLEHHAVLHSADFFTRQLSKELEFVSLDSRGNVDMSDLRERLRKGPKALVSLMHGNNEIGNITNLETVGLICKENQALFHSDTVQTVGHFPFDLKSTPVDFIVGSAHKFHGPKGIGFLYVKGGLKIPPFVHGGAQERNMRGGTENLYGIVGMTEALRLAYDELDDRKSKIVSVKKHIIHRLQSEMPGIEFNGESDNLENSLYTVLSLSTPASDINEMLLFRLDINRISISGGSACTSGTDIGSHVIEALGVEQDRGTLRLSFSHLNTLEEADFVVDTLKEVFA